MPKQGITFQDLGNLLSRDPMWVAAMFRQASASEDEKQTSWWNCQRFLSELTEFPVKGSLDPVIPTDPLIYRFYEIMPLWDAPESIDP